jgi:hypothetical protein
MAKTSTGTAYPKFNIEAVVAMQKANLETILQAQKVLAETAQAVVKLQAGWLNEVAQRATASMKVGGAHKPETMFADAKASAERALGVARQGIDLSLRAQSEVVDLFTARAAANVDSVKALAA